MKSAKYYTKITTQKAEKYLKLRKSVRKKKKKKKKENLNPLVSGSNTS